MNRKELIEKLGNPDALLLDSGQCGQAAALLKKGASLKQVASVLGRHNPVVVWLHVSGSLPLDGLEESSKQLMSHSEIKRRLGSPAIYHFEADICEEALKRLERGETLASVIEDMRDGEVKRWLMGVTVCPEPMRQTISKEDIATSKTVGAALKSKGDSAQGLHREFVNHVGNKMDALMPPIAPFNAPQKVPGFAMAEDAVGNPFIINLACVRTLAPSAQMDGATLATMGSRNSGHEALFYIKKTLSQVAKMLGIEPEPEPEPPANLGESGKLKAKAELIRLLKKCAETPFETAIFSEVEAKRVLYMMSMRYKKANIIDAVEGGRAKMTLVRHLTGEMGANDY